MTTELSPTSTEEGITASIKFISFDSVYYPCFIANKGVDELQQLLADGNLPCFKNKYFFVLKQAMKLITTQSFYAYKPVAISLGDARLLQYNEGDGVDFCTNMGAAQTTADSLRQDSKEMCCWKNGMHHARKIMEVALGDDDDDDFMADLLQETDHNNEVQVDVAQPEHSPPTFMDSCMLSLDRQQLSDLESSDSPDPKASSPAKRAFEKYPALPSQRDGCKTARLSGVSPPETTAVASKETQIGTLPMKEQHTSGKRSLEGDYLVMHPAKKTKHTTNDFQGTAEMKATIVSPDRVEQTCKMEATTLSYEDLPGFDKDAFEKFADAAKGIIAVDNVKGDKTKRNYFYKASVVQLMKDLGMKTVPGNGLVNYFFLYPGGRGVKDGKEGIDYVVSEHAMAKFAHEKLGWVGEPLAATSGRPRRLRLETQ